MPPATKNNKKTTAPKNKKAVKTAPKTAPKPAPAPVPAPVPVQYLHQ